MGPHEDVGGLFGVPLDGFPFVLKSFPLFGYAFTTRNFLFPTSLIRSDGISFFHSQIASTSGLCPETPSPPAFSSFGR